MTNDNGEPGVPARPAQALFFTRQLCDSAQGQDGRDARRSTPLTNYFCVGAWFCGADGVGVVCDFVCAGFTPENTDAGPVRRAA